MCSIHSVLHTPTDVALIKVRCNEKIADQTSSTRAIDPSRGRGRDVRRRPLIIRPCDGSPMRAQASTRRPADYHRPRLDSATVGRRRWPSRQHLEATASATATATASPFKAKYARISCGSSRKATRAGSNASRRRSSSTCGTTTTKTVGDARLDLYGS